MQKKSTKRTAKRKEPNAHASAVAILEFMNSNKIPDFLANVVQETIDHVCQHLDPHRPFKMSYAPEDASHDMNILMAVCRRTRMLDLQALENSEAGLARHILAIYNHPLTPTNLYNHVADFVTSGTNLKDENGNTPLDDWAFSTRTVSQIVGLANQHDKNEIREVVQ